MNSILLLLTLGLAPNVHAMNIVAVGLEVAHLLLDEPRATSLSLDQLIDETNAYRDLKNSGVGHFGEGFYDGRSNVVKDELTDHLADQLSVDQFSTRAFALDFVKEQRTYSRHRDRFVTRFAERVARGRTFKAYSVLPHLDAYVAASPHTLRRVHADHPKQAEAAHERLTTYLARQARGDASTILAALQIKTELEQCSSHLLADVIAKDYP